MLNLNRSARSLLVAAAVSTVITLGTASVLSLATNGAALRVDGGVIPTVG